MRRFHLLLVVSILAAAACDGGTAGPADDPAVTAAAAVITAADVAQRVGVIASDSMKGRFTMRPEIDTAAAYLAGTLDSLGLEPGAGTSFLQGYQLRYDYLDTTSLILAVDGAADPGLAYGADYVQVASVVGDTTGPILWGGTLGSTPTAGGLDMTGKVVLLDFPIDQLDIPAFLQLSEVDPDLHDGGAAAVVYVVGSGFGADRMAQAAGFTQWWRWGRPTAWVTEGAARTLLADAGADLDTLRAGGAQAVGGAIRMRATTVNRTAGPSNVIAVLPGSDPGLQDEYVVVSAHYDHLGTGIPDATGDSISNGADDNGSGTTAVLEVARAMAALERAPARSVMFLLVSGEEEGLLGSSFFAGNPTVPMGDIVANINLDMVGRNDPDGIFLIGGDYTTMGEDLTGIAADNPSLGLDVAPDPAPEEHLFFRSDQLSFVCRDVPAVFLTSGLHADYHLPSDEVDKLDTDKIARVARLAFRLAYAVADARDAPEWTAEGQAALAEITCP